MNWFKKFSIFSIFIISFTSFVESLPCLIIKRFKFNIKKKTLENKIYPFSELNENGYFYIKINEKNYRHIFNILNQYLFNVFKDISYTLRIEKCLKDDEKVKAYCFGLYINKNIRDLKRKKFIYFWSENENYLNYFISLLILKKENDYHLFEKKSLDLKPMYSKQFDDIYPYSKFQYLTNNELVKMLSRYNNLSQQEFLANLKYINEKSKMIFNFKNKKFTNVDFVFC